MCECAWLEMVVVAFRHKEEHFSTFKMLNMTGKTRFYWSANPKTVQKLPPAQLQFAVSQEVTVGPLYFFAHR